MKNLFEKKKITTSFRYVKRMDRRWWATRAFGDGSGRKKTCGHTKKMEKSICQVKEEITMEGI